jgi:hypothetical protein
VTPQSTATAANPASVWIKTVLTGTVGGRKTGALLFSLNCRWHDNDDPVSRGSVRPSSWSCEQKGVDLELVAKSFEVVRAETKDLGYVRAEGWYGTPKIELYEREFTVDYIDTLTLPGRLTFSCPRPLKDLPPLGGALSGLRMLR